MSMRFGWCFIGTGNIAHKVFKDTPEMNVVSVFSRSLQKAQAFASLTGAMTFESAEAAMTTPGVDAVYICTPHNTHTDYAQLALRLGKPVLCEKPFALSTAEATPMVAAARNSNVYLMEAMWTRFNPVSLKVQEWIDHGRIGTLHYAEIGFGIQPPYDPSNRFFNPELGGGSLLDLAVYPITYAQMLFRSIPDRITSEVTFADTGVDDKNVIILKYPGNRIATLYSGLRFKSQQLAVIYGSSGWINVPVFWGARSANLYDSNGSLIETFTRTDPCIGWKYEIESFEKDVLEGKRESEIMPLQASLDVLAIMDTVHAQMAR